jgi:AraC-like DNA-binding protein
MVRKKPSTFFRPKPVAMLVSPVLYLFAATEPGRPKTYLPHKHNDFQFIAVTRPSYRARLNGSEFDVPPGHLLVISPGDIHEDILSPSVFYFTLNYSIHRDTGGGVQSIFHKATTQRVFPLTEAMRSLLQNMYDDARRGDALSHRIFSLRGAEFFWHFIRTCPSNVLLPSLSLSTRNQAFVRRLKALFERSVNKPLTVADMANEMKMSESSFAHHATALLGSSPVKAFINFRLERSADLILQTTRPVKTIAEVFGFPNQFYYSRIFRARFGESPREYRKRLRPQ